MSNTPESPLTELDVLLGRLEDRLLRTKSAYIESIRPPDEGGSEKKSFFEGLRRLTTATTTPRPSPTATPGSSTHSHSNEYETAQLINQQPSMLASGRSPASSEEKKKESDSPETKQNPSGTSSFTEKRKARFINIPDQESFIEDLRRIAEIVVIGENYVTSQEKKQQKEFQKSRQKWSADRDLIGDQPSETSFDKEPPEEQSPDLADVFDLFFERNTLATLVELLTGRGCFDTPDIHDMVAKAQSAPVSSNSFRKQRVENNILLPPLAIATQAVQSISILVQNVSRATSLYILFSNDYINDMISLDLDLYEEAERTRRLDKGEKPGSVHASPEVAELTTHFVTFLKSLALRMNVETLQFFLQYPEAVGGVAGKPEKSESSNQNNLIEGYDPTSLTVKFPLFDRALDFCQAHQDSFVRVTAMNICLNTIRLTTVSDPSPPPPNEENLEEEEGAFGGAVISTSEQPRSTSTPDAALHNAEALPFRERLAIAQHTCTPSRVERLIAPIFTKLSERWTSIDEAIREMDEHEMRSAAGPTEDPGGVSSARADKVAKVREKVRREKLITAFRDAAADLQDELLLLEDVFKVGLTVLNEQMIEMMLATFVYPMLLQPLILFSQRFSAIVLNADSTSVPNRRRTFKHPFGAAFTGDHHKAQAQLARVTGPAKTALFTMASAFEFLTNPPLLRLMFTALLHPISPDSTTVPTVRSSLQVASVDIYGRGTIRVDNVVEGDTVPDSRQSYPFGTNEINRRCSSSNFQLSDDSEGSEDGACVFVLAPALAEVLEFRGQDYSVIARTRPNSYRQALFQCIGMETDEFSLVRQLAVCTLDAAVSRLDPKLAADLLFGVNLKTFADDMPMDERTLDSDYAYQEHDRGLGGVAEMQSRHSINARRGSAVGTNLIGQVVSPLASAVLSSQRGINGEWKLFYSELAAHCLLLISKGNGNGLLSASKTFESRRNEAAQFVANLPELMHSPRGGGAASYFLVGIPHVNVSDYDQQMYGAVMNVIVNGVSAGEKECPIEKFLQLEKTSSDGTEEGYSVEISSTGDFNDLTNLIANVFLSASEKPSVRQRSVNRDFMELRESVMAFFQSDALLSLLKDLAATNGLALQGVNAAGLALSRDGTFVQTMDWKHTKKIFSPISLRLTDVLFSANGANITVSPGTKLKLAGYPAIPCVCEAPASLAHLFENEGSGIVAQGITWQSLYLVFKDDCMIFAQPIPGGVSGEGRVIGACLLERTYVDKDVAPVDNGSPARRLLFAYSTFDPTPPPLFLYDELPEENKGHPLAQVSSFISNLDVWCENERAADYAYQVASSQIFAAKSKRGRRVQNSIVSQ